MTSTRLMVSYFDGKTSRAHEVVMWLDQGMLQLSSAQLIRQVALSQVDWAERTRHGARLAHFADGGTVQALDDKAWDSWMHEQGLGTPLAVRAHQSWRWSMLATTVLLMVAALGYWWGLPMAARAIAPMIPSAVSHEMSTATLRAMDDQWLHPSQLAPDEQNRWRGRLMPALEVGRVGHRPAALATPRITLEFRQARIGPNAFALPDGSIVITDELIELLKDREDVLIGVLGHEAGHVALRHGLRGLTQAGLLSVAGSVAFGDFSGVLAGAPALLGHLAYSRDFEREADEAAIALMRANHLRPSAMAVFFQRLREYRSKRGEFDSGLGIAFSSHPADAERIARFQAADLGTDAPQSSSTTSL